MPTSASAFDDADPFGSGLAAHVAGLVRLETARRGFSQQDVAQIVGRSRTAVSQRFTGKVPWSIDDIGTIARAYGCPLRDLLDWERPLPRSTPTWW